MNIIKTIYPCKEKNTSPSQESQQVNNQKPKNQPPKISPLLIAYMAIFDSVQLHHQTLVVQAKELQLNINSQNVMIDKQAQMKFVTLPREYYRWQPWVDSKTGESGWGWHLDLSSLSASKVSKLLGSISSANQIIEANRAVLGDKLNLLKQDAQIKSTGINSTMDGTQQAIQQVGNIAQMLVTLVNQISRI